MGSNPISKKLKHLMDTLVIKERHK